MTSRGWATPLPVRRVEKSRYAVLPASEDQPPRWPLTVPAVRQVLDDGMDLSRVTVLVGENGSGKSTLIEAIAMAFGLNAEGGSTGAQHRTHASESPLHEWLTLVRGPGASKWGYFVRAETMHGLFTYLDTSRELSPWTRDPLFHGLSHGESFVALLSSKRFSGPGLFVLDEPEAGLSFQAQLHLVAELAEMGQREGAQVLLATHSPIIASVPGARILQLDVAGITATAWEDLAVVDHYRRYLAHPAQYLRHVLDPW